MAWWNSHQMLKVHPKIVSGWGVLSRACPDLGLPCFVRRLCSWGLLLCRSLIYPHGLRTTCSPRSDRENTTVFFYDSVLYNDVCHSSTPDLAKCLWATSYLRALKGLGITPLVKACTVMASSLVCSFTTCTSNLFKNSFKDSLWYCLTLKIS